MQGYAMYNTIFNILTLWSHTYSKTYDEKRPIISICGRACVPCEVSNTYRNCWKGRFSKCSKTL